MKIFLTGATGFIGRHVPGRLLREGHEVIASARGAGSSLTLRAAGAEPFERSLLDESALRTAMQDCSAVVQGPGPMCGVDESCATTRRPDLPYSSTKAKADAVVLQAAGPGLRTLALRPPLVWGAGDTVDGELGMRVARGRFGWFSGDRCPYATCHVDNLCEAVALALHSQRSGEAFFITDREPVELRDLLGRRIEASGLPVPRLSIPADAAWVLAGLAEQAWRRLGLATEPPLTREAVRLLGYPFTLDDRRSHRRLGYRPVITIDQGLRQLHTRARTGAHLVETAHRAQAH